MPLGSVVPRRGQPLSAVGIEAYLIPFLLAAFLPGCGEDPTASNDTGRLLVRAVRQVPAASPSDQALCQVVMEVEVMLPDCTAYGPVELVREGSTFRGELHGARGRCHGHGTAIDSLDVCLPGMRQAPRRRRCRRGSTPSR